MIHWFLNFFIFSAIHYKNKPFLLDTSTQCNKWSGFGDLIDGQAQIRVGRVDSLPIYTCSFQKKTCWFLNLSFYPYGWFLNFFDLENLFLISKISTSGFLKIPKISLLILIKRFLLAPECVQIVQFFFIPKNCFKILFRHNIEIFPMEPFQNAFARLQHVAYDSQ